MKVAKLDENPATVWNPGDIVTWRGIFRQRVWHAHATIVVKDSPDALVLALLPGAQAVMPEGYVDGKRNGKRRWDFKDKPWKLEQYTWHTNRLLCLLEPEKYYATMYFWHGESNEFLCYYMNFQLPFRRSQNGIDTLDLELDLIIHPDLSFEWKDRDDYQQAIQRGVILEEWARGIDSASQEILRKLEKREYPLDGSWLDWKPERDCTPPKLPADWDRP